jgi:hypothetical protein
MALGGALWLWAWNDHQTLTGQWQSLAPDVTLPNQGDVDAAETRQRFGYLALGVGAGLAAVGAVTWLLARPSSVTAPPRGVSLSVGPGSLALSGRF